MGAGEELSFGVPIASIDAFLEACGFEQVVNADHVLLEKLYFSTGDRPRPVAEGYAIVTAVVRSEDGSQANLV